LAPATGVSAGALVFLLSDWLEAEMVRHMLIEFPLLLIAGAALAEAIPRRLSELTDRCNLLGLAGFALASITMAYWMIPSALDAALLHGPAQAAKYAGFVASGALLPRSFRAAPLALQAFFVGNVGWMMATAGIIYQNTPQQLCVNYLVGAQSVTGKGLVAAAIIIACAWCARTVPALLRDCDAQKLNQRSKLKCSELNRPGERNERPD
jgi:hypothetical protein